MDSRVNDLISRLDTTHFADLAGSELYGVIRIGEALLNESASIFLRDHAVVRSLVLHPRDGNAIDLELKLARPALLPTVKLTAHIERQPLPGDAVLELRLSGGSGVLKLAAPAIAASGRLPPGVRLEGERVFVDLRAVVNRSAHAGLLAHAEQLQVLSEEGRVVVAVQLRVR